MRNVDKKVIYEVERIKRDIAESYEVIIEQYQEIIRLLDDEYWDNKDLTEDDKRYVLYMIMYYQRFINEYDKLIDDLNY